MCLKRPARAYGVTAPTVRKWLGRFLAQGQAADGLAPSDCAGQGAGYRGAAPQAADPSAHRPGAGRVSQHRQPRPGPRRSVAPGRPGAGRAGGAMRPRADGLAPSDCAGQGAGYRGAAPQAADPSAHRQPGRSASPSAASWPAPAVAQPGATSIRPPAICCTSTSRSWDVSSALARSRDAIPLRGPAGTSSSWPSMTTPAWPSPTSTPTSASPAPSSSSRTQWPTTSAWA
ncbi:hypothetical protein L561_2023 [Bordetella pertussis STO1-CHOC-0019]|nr:hypothetical protein L561_2023 [Bordetella pertussis STO1-CHOC-0019]